MSAYSGNGVIEIGSHPEPELERHVPQKPAKYAVSLRYHLKYESGDGNSEIEKVLGRKGESVSC